MDHEAGLRLMSTTAKLERRADRLAVHTHDAARRVLRPLEDDGLRRVRLLAVQAYVKINQ